ncbi:MAG: DUF1156 domain-containing protein, partial [Deltaproteobacteria bacterium]
VGRGLVKAAHPGETPLVVDPFAGGGSIRLEALRLGCETFASDLNPVACLILKVMLEDIPRHGPELAEELRRVGKEIKEAAEKELAEFYPTDPDGSKPIAYLWARTVQCETPNCGAEIPLMRSFWLCKKPNRKRALRPLLSSLSLSHEERKKNERPEVEFEIFEPKNDNEVPPGTVTRAKATCLCCGSVLPPESVRAQLAAQRGGADVIFDEKGKRIGGARMLAVVRLKPGEQGRNYRLPTEHDYGAVRKAKKKLQEILNQWERSGRRGLCPIPDEPLPPIGTLGFRVQRYGMLHWGDLFTDRQKVALLDFINRIKAWNTRPDLQELLGLTLNHTTERCSSLCRWSPEPYMETVLGVFGRQALPIVWDFAEAVTTSESTGSFMHGLKVKSQAVQEALLLGRVGQVHQGDARESFLPDASAKVWFTDPPYYDAIPYSDLSDFFFVWLKRVLPGRPLFRDPFDPSNPLSPKTQEAVQDKTRTFEGRPKDRRFFEESMGKAFFQGRNLLGEEGIGSVVFAHKTTEGWEALLSGMVQAGWTITASWPVATERPNRLRSQESAALATSVHLVCRPRSEDAPVGDWGEVLRELPKRVGDWIQRLQSEGIRGADLVFACIGPALEIFSRYPKVVDAEERDIPLGGDPEASEPHRRGFLAYVWEVVGRSALEQVLGTAEGKGRNGAGGALEEDARLTALFLWTLQSTNGNGTKDIEKDVETEGDEEDEEEEAPKKKKQGYSLIFDVARRFAQPLGIHLPEWEGRIIETEKGIVRLLSVKERAKQLFGEDSGQAFAERLERTPTGPMQLMLFPEGGKGAAPDIKVRGQGRKRKSGSQVSDEELRTRKEATTLDRVHVAMLLQAGSRANALRALLKAEQDRSPDFLRLANALSALYPKDSEEKRLLDAMLLAMPR